MNASKEEARNANAALEQAALLLDALESGPDHGVKRCLLRVQNFLEAAERKLPSKAAYRREEKKPRRRTKLANG